MGSREVQKRALGIFSNVLSEILIAQGIFYTLTGIWPVLHIRSFEAVTGPKHDKWLVKTVGLLITVIGVALVVAGSKGPAGTPIVVLAAVSAGVLAGVDFYYVLRGVISKAYLADGVVELVLVVLLVLASDPG
jgi:hypothetical protein